MAEASESKRRILLVGRDARTDAIAEACAADGVALSVCLDLRTPGLIAKCPDVRVVGSLRDVPALVEHARQLEPDCVIVGPEDPLDAGLVDALEAEGIECFGPRKELAQIETSKGWARDLLSSHGVDGVPEYRCFSDERGLREYLDQLGACVVKPDGLTGGKGVKVLDEHLASVDEAFAYARDLVRQQGSVVIEERLEGEEFSLQSITDGDTVVHCPVVQDHKRAFEGDTGPNTGGMGSYSCADHSMPFLVPGDLEQARRINEAVVEALQSETGMPYRGVLYGGFMVTRDGVRVIEYNARFGDPEAMNVLPLLETSFVDLCQAVTEGSLHRVTVRFAARASVCKYLVPAGYPERVEKGQEIEVDLARIAKLGARVYFAAVEARDGRLLLTGSRAVAVVGSGADADAAQKIAEQATAAVSGPVRHRSDIGTGPLVAARTEHMRRLRGASGCANRGQIYFPAQSPPPGPSGRGK